MIKVRWRGSEAVQFPLPAGIERNNSHGWMTGRRGPTNQRLNSESVRIGQETDSQNRVSESLIPSASSPVPSMHPRNEGKSLSPAWLRDQYHSFTARGMPMAWHFPEAWCSILIEQWFSGPPCVYPLVLVRPSFLQTRWGLMILAKDSAQTTAQSVSISRRAVLAQLYAQLQPSTQRQGGKETNRQVHVRAAIARATSPGPADENHHGDAREDLLPVAVMHGCKYCTVPYGICSAYPIIILSTLCLSERDIPRMADWQNCWKRAMNRQLDNYVGGGLFCRMGAAVGIAFACSVSHFPVTEPVSTLNVKYRKEPCQDGLLLAWF
ncbi:hypothetical protein FOC1_g10010498 [Fusarium oxysporum f. sp. cubense race 1]|uniref:Uncharacterized protein n=1 Tax=Fusarium oxysporum f. sp. cubense (strain race 1) TaxID=1229664 RepID=N4UUZ7_FUSC1|nr:hypothetical protein FOC1_g10010498 [Fusarium oxysporum f. sp. cubense race 1]